MPRAATAAQRALHLVAMHERRAPAATRREAVGQHRDAPRRTSRAQLAIRPRAAGRARTARPRRSRGTRLRRRSAARARRAARRARRSRSSSPRRIARSSAAHSTRSSRDTGNSRPFGSPGNRVAGAADPLEERRDPMRRSDLADEIDVADVDAELERRRGDQRLELPALQPRLGVQPLLLRQAAVMRRDRVLAEPLAQVARDPLGHPPRVDEDERRPVLVRSASSAGRRTPPTPRATSPRRAATGNLERQIDRAAMAFVDDRAARRRPTPTRNRATSSIGFCVAESPMRRSGCSRDVLRAARATARGARRGACRSRRGSRRR